MRYGLVGIYENFSQRRSNMVVELSCYGTSAMKVEIGRSVALHPVNDPICLEPCMWAYGHDLGLNLSFLYSTLAHEWSYAQRGIGSLTFHSVLDIYAEMVMYHRRQKWLEPLIERAIRDYDLLVNVRLNYNEEKPRKYSSIIRKLMLRFKGNYVQAYDAKDAIRLINDHYTTATNKIHGQQTQSDSPNPETPARED